ncbi:BtrH N-terminal domain-containing protein [Planococcus sp. MB-3u-09]|uniref:BtrH N-terminal domain-containing protein n=1 Tax=Planococcus sp. MB-3u-09 TaxID=2058317 RepID=UPI000C7E564B|nr:BtrH N-terminal domain-containing protein [Planococcus sp. MB-3u-09]PKH37047.1 hypothetical protein CXF77_12745 [Planococcus sp. MB-3u-09]
MSVIRNKHCLYDSLGEILKNHEKILGEESVIFHSLGGYRFQVIKFDNFIPSYALRGNTLDFDLFFENTGVRVTRIEENTKEEALKNTYQELKVKGFQMVIANCYHLPFDTINYKKNSDNHMLLIHNYDRNKKCFIVSDSAHRAEISIEDLMLARKKNNTKKISIFQY